MSQTAERQITLTDLLLAIFCLLEVGLLSANHCLSEKLLWTREKSFGFLDAELMKVRKMKSQLENGKSSFIRFCLFPRPFKNQTNSLKDK